MPADKWEQYAAPVDKWDQYAQTDDPNAPKSFGLKSASGSWEPAGIAERFAQKFGSTIQGALEAPPMGITTQSQEPNAQGQYQPPTFGSMGQELKDFGNALLPIDELKQGNYAGAAGKTAANALLLGGAKRAVQGGSPLKLGPSILDEAKPTLTPDVQARNLARAINVPEAERPNLMKNLHDQAGTALDFADKNGIDIKHPLDFAKAARNAAEDTHKFFSDEIVKPVDGLVTAPKEYTGTKIGETGGISRTGQALLSDLYDRSSKINTEIMSDYDKKQPGITREALANDSKLVAERDSINRVLYDELSKKTGIPADQLQAVRQRYGALYNIADKTESAVNARERGVDITAEGRSHYALSKAAIATQAVAKALGLSPENIATRRILKAISDVDIPPTELPQVKPPLRFNLGGK